MDKDKTPDKEKTTIPEIVETEINDIEKYPDHLKTNPNDSLETPDDADIPEILDQGADPTEYPDHLKTNPDAKEE